MQHIKVSRLSILPKFFRSTKSENVQLENSQYIENLQVIAKIFEEKLPNYQFALSKISDLSKPENMKIYYIGTKVKNHANGLKNIYDINGNKLVDLNDKEELTLFKHLDSDYYYYDVLDQDKKYEEITEGLFFCVNACKNLESLEQFVKQYKK